MSNEDLHKVIHEHESKEEQEYVERMSPKRTEAITTLLNVHLPEWETELDDSYNSLEEYVESKGFSIEVLRLPLSEKITMYKINGVLKENLDTIFID